MFAGTLLIAAFALVHTPWFVERLSSPPSCPFGADARLSSAEKDVLRQAQAARLRGTAAASVRPSLGFALDKSFRRDIVEWAAARGSRCLSNKARGGLECRATASTPPLTPGEASYFFTFNRDELLKEVGVVKSVPSAQDAVGILDRVLSQLAPITNSPSLKERADERAAYLQSGTLHQLAHEHHFTNYYARARATNMGSSAGYTISLSYQSLVD